MMARLARQLPSKNRENIISLVPDQLIVLWSSAIDMFPPVVSFISVFTRVGPIYRLADIYGQYRYRYIGIGKLDIGIGHIGSGLCIG